MRYLLPLLLPLAMAACVLNIDLKPQIPPETGAPRLPMKVALIVPPATRRIVQAELLPSGCFGLAISSAPLGDLFAKTVEGILQQTFEQVVTLEALPAPKDAKLIVEASLSRVGMKPACGASPEFYGQADGALRTLDASGREIAHSVRTSARVDEPTPRNSMDPYKTIMPKAMANLASAWAIELAAAAAARLEAPAPSGAGTSEAKPWWN